MTTTAASSIEIRSLVDDGGHTVAYFAKGKPFKPAMVDAIQAHDEALPWDFRAGYPDDESEVRVEYWRWVPKGRAFPGEVVAHPAEKGQRGAFAVTVWWAIG